MSPAKAPARDELDEDADDWELQARALDSRVRKINRLLTGNDGLEDYIHWCEHHGRDKEASEARQFAARLRSTSADLINEARAIRAQMQG